MTPRRSLLSFAALVTGAALLGGSPAVAQTVKVRNAAPGATIELVFGGTRVASTAADERGAVDVPVPAASAAAGDIDALVFVDECGTRRRVIVGPQGASPAPQEAACVRREIPGIFLVRPTSTIVVNVGTAMPTLLLRQGAFDPDAPPREWAKAPRGLVVSGGAGLTFLGNAAGLACGTVADCNGDNSAYGFSANVAYWFSPYVAAEAGWMRPGAMTAEGNGGTFRFTSELDSRLLTLGGRVGVPVGPVRFYGKAAADYHWASFTTTQTIDPTSITVDGVAVAVPGGSQTLAIDTSGWDWVFGGGMEFWFNRFLAAHAEFGRAGLKGNALNDAEGLIEDRVFYLVVGASVRIGR